MFRRLIALLIGLAGSGLVMSCGSSSPATRSVSGSVVLGPVAAGTIVSFFGATAAGEIDRSSPLGQGTLNASSAFSASLSALPSSGIIFAVLTGPFQFTNPDGSTGTVAQGVEVRFILPVSGTGDLSFNLTDLALIASQGYEVERASGTESPYEDAVRIFSRVADAFGIPDPLGTPPAVFSGQIPNNDAGRYAAVLLALHTQAASGGLSLIDLALAYGKLLADTGNLASSTSVSITDSSGNPRSIAPNFAGFNSDLATIVAGGTNGVTFAPGFTIATTDPMPVVDTTKIFGQTPPDAGSGGIGAGGSSLEACRQGSEGQCLNGGAFCSKGSGTGTCTSTNTGCYCI